MKNVSHLPTEASGRVVSSRGSIFAVLTLAVAGLGCGADAKGLFPRSAITINDGEVRSDEGVSTNDGARLPDGASDLDVQAVDAGGFDAGTVDVGMRVDTGVIDSGSVVDTGGTPIDMGMQTVDVPVMPPTDRGMVVEDRGVTVMDSGSHCGVIGPASFGDVLSNGERWVNLRAARDSVVLQIPVSSNCDLATLTGGSGNISLSFSGVTMPPQTIRVFVDDSDSTKRLTGSVNLNGMPDMVNSVTMTASVMGNAIVTNFSADFVAPSITSAQSALGAFRGSNYLFTVTFSEPVRAVFDWVRLSDGQSYLPHGQLTINCDQANESTTCRASVPGSGGATQTQLCGVSSFPIPMVARVASRGCEIANGRVFDWNPSAPAGDPTAPRTFVMNPNDFNSTLAQMMAATPPATSVGLNIAAIDRAGNWTVVRRTINR